MEEKCYYHPTQPAVKWRKRIFNDNKPEQIFLCNECVMNIQEFRLFPTYEMNERIKDENKYSE